MAGRGNRKSKRLPRPSRTLGRQKKPSVSTYMTRLWQDPVWRAALTEKRRLIGLAKRGKPSTRTGVPDGMRKVDADKLNAEAEESAKETMKELKQAGVLEGTDARAEEALTQAVKIMRAPGDKKTKIAAARLVLEYTKSKPASKSEVTVNEAEKWLNEVAGKNDTDKGETSQDA